jgi:orotate phosphoribosyltransferase
MTEHERLVQILATRSARRGQFTLASGARSTLYIDARITAMSPEGLSTIGPLAVEALDQSGWRPDSVGGLTLGADPVSYAIAYASALASTAGKATGSGGRLPLRAFTVRKEAKGHGTGKLIEGPFEPVDRVAVVEDVITTGGSALKAIDAIRAAGATVVGVIALVDREEGGRMRIEQAGYPVITLTTATDIIARMA